MGEKLKEYDFLKGVAIIFVLLLHTLNPNILLWIHSEFSIGQAVPIFIFVTFYLSFNSLQKKEDTFSYWFSKNRVKTLLAKIILPFLCIQFLILGIYLITGKFDRICLLAQNGGKGPGSYYFWIYLQFWIAIPFIYSLFKKCHVIWATIIIFGFSQILQFLCVFLNCSEELYRLLCFRYIPLSILAYVFLKYKIKWYYYAIFLLISTIYFFSLGHFNYQPWLYDSWMQQQLPGFLYTICIVNLLVILYKKYKQNILIKWIENIGTISYKIFLLQMFILAFISINNFSFITNQILAQVIFCTTMLFVCITPPLLLFFKRNKILK